MRQDLSPPSNLEPIERVVLAGFMGCGKTTVGALLSKHLGWQFLDLDHEIERREGLAVPHIFAEKGEPEFRRVESMVLASLLQRRKVVIALGGGALEVPANRVSLQQTERTVTVHLTAPFRVLVERCRRQEGATERPVLSNLETAQERFTLRQKVYAELADFSLDTSMLTQDEAADAVVKMLGIQG